MLCCITSTCLSLSTEQVCYHCLCMVLYHYVLQKYLYVIYNTLFTAFLLSGMFFFNFYIFKLDYFPFIFNICLMKNGNFFTIYFCCNNTCFLGVMSFSPEIIGKRVSEKGFLSKVDELECVSVYVCNINTIICFKMLIFTGRSNFSQCGLEPTGPDRNIRVVSGGWLHLD